jgi:rSAM/selenodomain-associated transferase 1
MARRLPAAPRRANFANHLVIMAKAPAMGRAKHRLAREIGEIAALRFYRTCLAHTVSRLAQDPRWHVWLAVEPDHAMAESVCPARTCVALLPQGRGDLGCRMQRLFARLPPGPAIIVGSDIPAIRPAHVAHAFRLLGAADAVFGRAPDGGYWLIGLKRTPKALRPFAGVRWSSSHALADTLANLDGRHVAFAATLRDIDTKTDLSQERYRAERFIFSDNRPHQSRL